jgi:hypothetical protein
LPILPPIAAIERRQHRAVLFVERARRLGHALALEPIAKQNWFEFSLRFSGPLNHVTK